MSKSTIDRLIPGKKYKYDFPKAAGKTVQGLHPSCKCIDVLQQNGTVSMAFTHKSGRKSYYVKVTYTDGTHDIFQVRQTNNRHSPI